MPLYAVEVVRGLLTDGRIERRGDVYEPVGDLAQLVVLAREWLELLEPVQHL